MQRLTVFLKVFIITPLLLTLSLPGYSAKLDDLPEDWLSKTRHVEVSILIPEYPLNVLLPPSRDTILSFSDCNNGYTKIPRAAIGFNKPIPYYFSHIKPGESITGYDPHTINTLINHQQLRQTIYNDIEKLFSGISSQKTTFSWANTPVSAITLLQESNDRLAAGQKLPNAIIQLSVRLFFNNVSADPIFSRLWVATQMQIYTLPNAKPKTRLRKKELFKRVHEQRFVSNYDLRQYYEDIKTKCPKNTSEQIAKRLYKNNGEIVKQAINFLWEDSKNMYQRFFIKNPTHLYQQRQKKWSEIYFSKRTPDQPTLMKTEQNSQNGFFDETALTEYWQLLTKAQTKRVLRRENEAAALYLGRKAFYNKIESKIIDTYQQRLITLGKDKTYYSLAKDDSFIQSIELQKELRKSAIAYIEKNQ